MCKFRKLAILLAMFWLTGCGEKLVEYTNNFERWRSQLEEKKIQLDGFSISYLEGGSGPTLMLIHGFSADKDHWTRFSRQLTTNFHVIALDLPGFGQSSQIPGLSYNAKSQADRLEKLRIALKIDAMHLLGNSMGGMIAADYSRKHPEKVLSLSFFDTGGIRTSQLTDFAKELVVGRNPLLIKKPEDFDLLLDFNFVKSPFMPSPVKSYLSEKLMSNFAWNQGIFAEILQELSIVEEALPSIQAPLLVVWGQNDRIVDVSSTELIKHMRPDAEIHILDACGHLPMMEKAEESAQIYLSFLKRIQTQAETKVQ